MTVAVLACDGTRAAEPLGGRAVLGGLIHHWRGAAFIPDVTLDEIIAIAQDYPGYVGTHEWGVGGGYSTTSTVTIGL